MLARAQVGGEDHRLIPGRAGDDDVLAGGFVAIAGPPSELGRQQLGALGAASLQMPGP